MKKSIIAFALLSLASAFMHGVIITNYRVPNYCDAAMRGWKIGAQVIALARTLAQKIMTTE